MVEEIKKERGNVLVKCNYCKYEYRISVKAYDKLRHLDSFRAPCIRCVVVLSGL